MWGPLLLLTGCPCRPWLLAGKQASRERCSLFAKSQSLPVPPPWITYSCVASWTAALTWLTWQHHTRNPDPPSQEKMEYLLVSCFTKTASSTIYKLNRNFHYFSWHNWLHLSTDKRDATGAFRKPALATANHGREGDEVYAKGSPPPATALFLLIHSSAVPVPNLQLV